MRAAGLQEDIYNGGNVINLVNRDWSDLSFPLTNCIASDKTNKDNILNMVIKSDCVRLDSNYDCCLEFLVGL